MLTVLARFQVKAGQAARFQELCAELIAATRQEQGCVSYELFQDKADGNKFSFIEFWQTQADLDAHSASEHFTRIVPQLVDISDEVMVQTFEKVA